MRHGIRSDLRGGAVVELAICMVVVVPLILYSTWFADVAHWKIKLEEASMGPVMDLTAWKVSDFSKTSPNFAGYYGNAISGAQGGGSAIPTKMDSSFDSTDRNASTYASSVFVRPRGLNVTCRHFASGKPNRTVSYDSSYNTNESRPGDDVPEFNLHAWVTCKSTANIATVGMPKQFQEMASLSSTNPGNQRWVTFKMCGLGPGVQGCGDNADDGLSIMLDDWGLWNADEHENVEIPLSLGVWDDPTPSTWVADAMSPASESNVKNLDYFKMAKRYWRDPDPGTVKAVMWDVAHAEDMGLTDDFHMSYRKGSDYRYGDGSNAHEMRWGQRDAYGGPNINTTVGPNGPPHTGGPWHEESAEHPNVSKSAFNMRLTGGPDGNRHYMGVPTWPADGPANP